MLAFALALAQQAPDPLLLQIGAKGTIEVVAPGLFDTQDGESATMAALVEKARGVRFVFIGESHDQAEHHKFQAEVIRALVADGRDVAVGFEMFTRDNQGNLAPWTLGWWSQEEFIENSNWKTQWGFDFNLYVPIFQAIKDDRLPMVALNVPRDWIRSVGRGGISALTEEQRQWVPNPDLNNSNHRALFSAMIGDAHPMTGDAANNMYAAQVTWDEGMATSALDYMNARASRKAVMVVIAGTGHMMYGQGINYRIGQKTGERVVNVACVTSTGARRVARGIADFVYVTQGEDGGPQVQ